MSGKIAGTWVDNSGHRHPYLGGTTNALNSYWLFWYEEIRKAYRDSRGDISVACKLLNDDGLPDQQGSPWKPAELQQALEWLRQNLR